MPSKNVKKTKAPSTKKAQKIESATVHIEGCTFEQNGPGPEQLTVLSNIAAALGENAQALNKLAGILKSPAALIIHSNNLPND